jgi:hypothetical protein
VIKPSPEVVTALAALSRSHPILVTWLSEWRSQELDRLPFVAPGAVAIAQGRCQVLTEMHKLLHDSQNLAAELRKK